MTCLFLIKQMFIEPLLCATHWTKSFRSLTWFPSYTILQASYCQILHFISGKLRLRRLNHVPTVKQLQEQRKKAVWCQILGNAASLVSMKSKAHSLLAPFLLSFLPIYILHFLLPSGNVSYSIWHVLRVRNIFVIIYVSPENSVHNCITILITVLT